MCSVISYRTCLLHSQRFEYKIKGEKGLLYVWWGKKGAGEREGGGRERERERRERAKKNKICKTKQQTAKAESSLV